MPRYKSIELEERLIPMIRHMNAVEEYREVLQNLQAVWDNLTLLGQLSGVGTDMNSTRQAFNQLTSSLLNQLCAETLKKTVAEMTAKAQVAIDILVRNLFERTADIGFLATDEDVRHFLREFAAKQGNIHNVEELNALRQALRGRFADYVSKYSVYSDIVLLDTTGRVVARLDESVSVEYSTDPLLAEAMSTTAAYVESFRRHDLLPDRVALGYSYRVTAEDGKPIGVLFLCFRLENELERIFSNLAAGDDWTLMTLVDNDGRVVASSDVFHVPLEAPLEKVLGEEYRIVRFGGREYLSVTRPTQGYQGYMGPGWYGHAMLPIQHAFNLDSSEMLKGIDPEMLADVMGNTALFGEELRRIPEQAERIQADLNRSVWNGNVRLGTTRQAINATFSKILLWEISNTGGKTKDVFERSIANLHETVVSAILQDSRFVASLAIDIMDRNLYERANDSRWWALTSAFRQTLAAGEVDEAAAQRLSGILAHINGLYTVYSNLLLFDANGRVLAVSNPEYAFLVGQVVQEEWARRVLALTDTQGYAVSAFNPSPLYGGGHTYIYGAAVHTPDGRNAIGGIGIVFDAAPQFAAMLRDALPRDKSGATVAEAFAVFAERNGRVIACSDDRLVPGDNVGLEPGWLTMKPGGTRAGILRMNDRYYAVGASASCGYREYKGANDGYRNDVTALVFLPLCEAVLLAQRPEIPRLAVESDRGSEAQSIEIATFHIGGTWFGLHSGSVVEAVDPGGITSVPGAGHIFAGYLIFNGLPTPVYDIGLMANAHSELPVQERQVIILRREDDVLFGILVDGLGEIPEIAEARLQPLPIMLAGGNVLGEAIVNADPGSENQLLLVLGADRIAARLKIPNAEAREALPFRREVAVPMIGP